MRRIHATYSLRSEVSDIHQGLWNLSGEKIEHEGWSTFKDPQSVTGASDGNVEILSEAYIRRQYRCRI